MIFHFYGFSWAFRYRLSLAIFLWAFDWLFWMHHLLPRLHQFWSRSRYSHHQPWPSIPPIDQVGFPLSWAILSFLFWTSLRAVWGTCAGLARTSASEYCFIQWLNAHPSSFGRTSGIVMSASAAPGLFTTGSGETVGALIVESWSAFGSCPGHLGCRVWHELPLVSWCS